MRKTLARGHAEVLATLFLVLPSALCAQEAGPSEVRPANSALERLQGIWSRLQGYSVTIESHEILSDSSQDRKLHYLFRKPEHAELDAMDGPAAGATVVWDGGDRVAAYKRGFGFFKIHADVHDKRVTSLRGNGVLTPDLGRVLSCYVDHRTALRETAGPAIDGDPTDEIELASAGGACPDDSAVDGHITLDVLDISRKSGLVVERRRYEGETVVERWDLHDYSLDEGDRVAK